VVPEDGETDSQGADETADHESSFVITLTGREAAPALGDQVEADTDSLGGTPAWVTVTVAGAAPSAVKVTVAVRDEVETLVSVLSVAVKEVLASGETRSHDADEEAVHRPQGVASTVAFSVLGR
jgi:hypothetical protein